MEWPPKRRRFFLDAHGPPGNVPSHHPTFVGQHGSLQRHSPGACANIPDHMTRRNAQQGQSRGPHGLFADQAAFYSQFFAVQPQARAARRFARREDQGAGRAEVAARSRSHAQMVHSFVRRAHALENMGVKPVAPVQQVPRQHVGGGARVCEHAEGRVFTRSRIERPQVVAAVQGKADDFVPGQGQAGAGLLQGTDRRQQPHGLFPQQPHCKVAPMPNNSGSPSASTSTRSPMARS